MKTTKTQKTTTKKEKTLLDKYKSHKNDTGSIQVQVALLTERIGQLSEHLGDHAKDNDSRRGLLILVGKRRKLLNYMAKSDEKAYTKLVKDLGLRK